MAAVELVGALGCSWSIARERESRGGGGGPERGGNQGSVVASPRMDRLEGEASSAKQEVAGVDPRHASPLFVLLAEEEEDKGEEVGWAATVEGQVSGLPGERQVVLLSLSISVFISVFYYSVNLGLY